MKSDSNLIDNAISSARILSTSTDDNLIQANQVEHILIFELGYTGHYPYYIRLLIKHWCENRLNGCLTIIVSPKFLQHHADVIQLTTSIRNSNVKFQVISDSEEASLIPRKNPFSRAWRALQEWHLLEKYVTSLHITHCLLLYFDSFQTAIALRRPLKCTFSGVYFRPTTHYSTFESHTSTFTNQLQAWREQLILPWVMAHSKFKYLFSLDPYFVATATKAGTQKITYLPDPVEPFPLYTSDELIKFRKHLNIKSGCKVFLLFGALYDSRKGVSQVLKALVELPPILSEQVCLLLVGQLGSDSPIYTRLRQFDSIHSTQVILQNEFVPDADVPLYFQIADVVLAPYQQHVGMSGILVQAAAAERPLLASNYGLLGELVRYWNLGLTVDSTSASEIAAGISRCLTEPLEKIGDRCKMRQFAKQHSSTNFANTIFSNLVPRWQVK